MPSPTTPAVPIQQDLVTLLRARTPLLLIDSAAETRVIEGFRHAIAQSLRPLYRWSITDGLKRLDMDAEDDRETPPDASLMLQALRQQRTPGIYLLLDFQPYLRYPMTLRLLREIAQRQDCAEHTLVLVGAGYELPAELDAVAVRFEFALPDADAMAALVREEAFNYSRENDGRRVVVDADAARAVVRNLKGLNLDDARRIVRKLIYDDGALTASDLPELARAKYALLDRDGLLHFEYDTAQFANVAGLARLKQWIAQRKPAFLGEKAAARLDPPKGVLLLGVQGCGKSLAAKATAGGFAVPLLRLDIGTLYNKYQGETERNLREALKNAELLAPCVLWIDEIEKALATDSADDGVSRRVLGYLLTWMAERTAPVFLVATANDVQALPAELLRKGRFDEVFFVDLPDAATRAEIFRLHLQRRKLQERNYDLAALAAASEGYSGAEIEQAIVAALYAAMSGKSPPSQQQVLDEIGNTRPLSVLMAERVDALREWARGRTVPAD
jgi:SpoVK/Ycf46/Vps4 family AAA+-type ATPase